MFESGLKQKGVFLWARRGLVLMTLRGCPGLIFLLNLARFDKSRISATLCLRARNSSRTSRGKSSKEPKVSKEIASKRV
jgi:hypothetical protein